MSVCPAAGRDDPLATAEELARAGRCWDALAVVRDTVAAPGAPRRGWAAVMRLAGRIGDDHGRLLAARRLHADAPEAVDAVVALAEALTDHGQADEAVALLVPLHAGARLDDQQSFRLSRMLMFAGRLAEAHGIARELLPRHPEDPMLWERLAQTGRPTDREAGIDALRALLRRGATASSAARAGLAGALARMCVDSGDDAGAAAALQEKAVANRERHPFDPGALRATIADIETHCAAPAGDRVTGDPSPLPIFVLGAARSGTSLVDQILGCHPQIAGGGELRCFWLATRELGDCGSASLERFAAAMPSGARLDDAWRVFGSRYLLLAAERFGSGRRFTDKLLSNVYRVEAIRRALPGARIVYLERDPLDIAWSCWRGQFDSESAWANSPAGIALYVAGYRRAMHAWRRRYPDAIATVGYESLARAPDTEIPRLLAHCGLPDAPATRHPERSQRPVATLSFAQVREPIGTRSVGAAAAFPLATRVLRQALRAEGLDGG